jgi:acetate---CoA ligase (ADP-forming)
MLHGLKTFPLLNGYRGRVPADLDAVRDLVLRVGALAAAHPAVAELDLNPSSPRPMARSVVAARVRLEAPGRPRPSLRSTPELACGPGDRELPRASRRYGPGVR